MMPFFLKRKVTVKLRTFFTLADRMLMFLLPKFTPFQTLRELSFFNEKQINVVGNILLSLVV